MNKESRETLHGAVRRGDLAAVQDMVSAEGGRTLARAQNSFGRNALHIAVLAEHEDIVTYLAENCPELLRLGDNVSIDVGVVDSANRLSQLDIGLNRPPEITTGVRFPVRGSHSSTFDPQCVMCRKTEVA